MNQTLRISSDSRRMIEMADRGYSYWVSDEQLQTFSSLSPARRLQWLEEIRELMHELAPSSVRESWARLRR
ncbi:MAG: hypothetical protein JWO36_3837 [Myxococcales bacterium]|nr:hypothetical protein [Myxococcales bacterium]